MQSEHREDRHAPDQEQEAERSEQHAKQAALPTPFASEGLERVRDSHC